MRSPINIALATSMITITLTNIFSTYLFSGLVEIGHLHKVSEGAKIGLVKAILDYFNLGHNLNNNKLI